MRPTTTASTPRIHILDSENHVGYFLHPGNSVFEGSRILTLPPKGWMDDNCRRAKRLGNIAGLIELSPRIGPPHPLSDEKTRCVNRKNRYLVVIDQALQVARS